MLLNTSDILNSYFSLSAYSIYGFTQIIFSQLFNSLTNNADLPSNVPSSEYLNLFNLIENIPY